MCRFAYARTARGGGNLKLAPQGFQDVCHSEGVYPKESSLLLIPKAGLLRHKPRNDKFGFTLAEVLITLGIIGVVAALTLPTLIQNYQKQATATSVKKAYSELNQILQMAKADYGDPSGWDYYGKDELDKWVQTYIEPYTIVIKAGSCVNVSKSSKCFGLAQIHPMGYPTDSYTSHPHYILIKGGDVFAYGFYRYGGTYESVTRVRVMVNSPKNGKAFIGKDVFTFIFDKTKQSPMFEPYGLGNSREDLLADRKMWAGACNSKASGSGYWGPGDACAAVIMLDGWKISKDYPW